jgi:hypothetical protein
MKIAIKKALDKDNSGVVIIYQSVCSVKNNQDTNAIEVTKHQTPSLLEFDPLNCVDFNVKDNVDIKAALNEALEFFQTHNVDQVNVYTADYVFMLDDEDQDTEEMYKEYLESKKD